MPSVRRSSGRGSPAGGNALLRRWRMPVTQAGAVLFAVALTVNGRPIAEGIDIYRLAEPVVSPTVAPVGGSGRIGTRNRRRAVRIGTAIGGATGCTFGTTTNRLYGEAGESARQCAFFGLVGAGIGAVGGALWNALP